MKPETLDFEEPISVLIKQIAEMQLMPRTEERHREIESLRRRIDLIRKELYLNLTPWQRVLVARHPSRPHMLDYVKRLFTDFVEIHGDRRFADDPAIITGFARLDGEEVMIVGNEKGRGTREKIYRNFGYAKPEGYRKALRAMKLAEKFDRTVVVFVDTPAAYPGAESEERGIAEAIAYNLREMAMLEVPIVVIIAGEGGSGGALGLAVGDQLLIQEYAVFSVIPPEGCAAILWRNAERKAEAAEALKLTAQDLLAMKVVDEIISEPIGGAHTDHEAAASLVEVRLRLAANKIRMLTKDERLERRYQKFRKIGSLGISKFLSRDVGLQPERS